jgi:serine/threonine protein kinase
LEQEHSLKAQLDPAWAVQPMALPDDGRRTVLVLEDPGGEPLDQLLETLMAPRLFLRLAVGSGAVRELHRRRIIHKDIKPANVMFKPNTGAVWLMGFGIASRLPRERQASESPEFITGTLPYMAPEQTGRMNRSIDSRADLYAFGVTLYLPRPYRRSLCGYSPRRLRSVIRLRPA